MTHWAKPFTGGGKGTLKSGEQVRITQEMLDPRPIGFYAQAVNYADVERQLVPSDERAGPSYSGFSLSLKTSELDGNFKLIHEDP